MATSQRLRANVDGIMGLATRVLDGGALGVVIPHVDTPEEAREIADRLRYPPLGGRCLTGHPPGADD
jgi:4-hydroxy-2-oxoheptanedioate aldolase